MQIVESNKIIVLLDSKVNLYSLLLLSVCPFVPSSVQMRFLDYFLFTQILNFVLPRLPPCDRESVLTPREGEVILWWIGKFVAQEIYIYTIAGQ